MLRSETRCVLVRLLRQKPEAELFLMQVNDVLKVMVDVTKEVLERAVDRSEQQKDEDFDDEEVCLETPCHLLPAASTCCNASIF
jgi:hypothetical protein